MRPVAFIYLHPHTCDDFFSDMPFSLCSGQLRAQGIAARVIQLYLKRDDPGRSGELLDLLVDHLEQERYGVVIFDQVWNTDIFRLVKARTGATLICTDPFAVPSIHVDLLLSHFSTNPLALVRLARAAASESGEDTAQVPNAWARQGETFHPASVPPEPRPVLPAPPFEPDLDHLLLNPDFRPPVRRKTLTPNSGCPHGLSALENDRFQATPLTGADIAIKGCSFCHQGGDYEGRSAHASAELILEQARKILDLDPGVEQFILRDQSCLRYLPHLLRGASRRGIPLHLLISARADQVVNQRERLEQALELCKPGGHSVELYLIGLENLSQPMLDLYNKGMTVQQCTQALEVARELHAAYPESFPLGRNKTSSFILFNPWITIEDLEQNIKIIKAHNVDEVAADLVLSRLRLYPNLPLYHLAREEDLLLDGPPGVWADNAAAAGYSAEHPWRFADPRSALVYDLLTRLWGEVPQDQQTWLLERCIEQARAQDPDDLVQAAARAEAALREQLASHAPLDSEIRLEDHEQRSPDTINIATTCNQRCVFCAGYSLAPLSDEEILERVRGRREVFFQGGEPTLNPSLFRYARHAREHGASHVTLVTNGLRLAYAGFTRKCLAAGIDQFFFALPSHREEVCDAMGQVPGSFALKLRALDNLSRLGAGPGVRLIHLLTRDNFADLADLPRFMAQRLPRMRSLEIKLMQCLGRARENRRLIPSLTELAPGLKRCLDFCGEAGIEVVVNGVPPCLLPGHAHRIMDFHMKQVTGQRVTGRRFLPTCHGCPLRGGCLGVRTDYLKIYGEAEIHATRAALEGAPTPPRPAPILPRQRGGSVAEDLGQETRQALAHGNPATAAAALRSLLGISGDLPGPEQLRRPVPEAWLTRSLTMQGFKPAELAMLRHGLKPVVKLEDIPEAEAETFHQQHGAGLTLVTSAPYVRDDLATDQLPSEQDTEAPRLVTLYASQGDEALRLRDLDRDGPRKHARQAGSLLGYPSCCVEHFAQVSERGHDAGVGVNEAVTRALWARTPRPDEPLPYLTSTYSDLGLVSFYPCNLRCPEALAWARRVEAVITADDKDLAARTLAACARPVLFFRLSFFVLFTGRMQAGSLYYQSFAMNLQGDPETQRLQRLLCRDLGPLLAAGDRLTVTNQELSIARGDRLVARLDKAHPQACLLLGFSDEDDLKEEGGHA